MRSSFESNRELVQDEEDHRDLTGTLATQPEDTGGVERLEPSVSSV